MSGIDAATPGRLDRLRVALAARLRRVTAPRSWAVNANDGVIATAGLLEGFSGAEASDAVLLTAAVAMLIAGSLSLGGSTWAQAEADRDAEKALIAEESAALAAHPEDELAELTAFWERKGLDPATARQVAEQLSAKDALAAQLEFEHGITEPTPAWSPRWQGAMAGLAFVLGAMVPLAITRLTPAATEPWAIVIAVVASLSLTAWIAARSSHISIGRMLLRSLTVGVGTMAASYLVGVLLF